MSEISNNFVWLRRKGGNIYLIDINIHFQ